MEQDKISIIVPVYNAESYLRKCIESIINQTYCNLEIILVNDGSTDDSVKICEEFKKKDKRIIVLNKKNGGPSSARNMGLDVATGDFIGFVDSDDWIDRDMFEYLYSLINKYSVKISVCGLYRDKSREAYNEAYAINEKCLEDSQAIDIIWENGFMCNKLFDAQLFREDFYEDKIRFNEKIFYVEDGPVLCKCISVAKKIAFSNKKKYHYLINPESITQNKFNLKQITSLLGFEEMIGICEKSFPNYSEKMKCEYVSINIGFTLNRAILDNKEYFEQLRGNIRRYIKVYLKAREISLKFKIASALISVSPSLFSLLTRLVVDNG